MKYLIASAFVVATAAPAMAQDVGFYATGGYTHLSADDFDLGALTVRGGAQFGDYFGAELEGSFGIRDDDVTTVVGGDAVAQGTIELNNTIGVFGTVGTQVTPNARVFARLGYASVDAEVSVDGAGSVSDSEEEFAYGLAGEYMFDGQNGVRVGYTAYDFEETLDTFEISYVRKF